MLKYLWPITVFFMFFSFGMVGLELLIESKAPTLPRLPAFKKLSLYLLPPLLLVAVICRLRGSYAQQRKFQVAERRDVQKTAKERCDSKPQAR